MTQSPVQTDAAKATQRKPSTARKFSVLLVCRSYPPVIGGSEIEAQRVCAGLIRRGHRMEVICCGGDPMPATRRWIDPHGVPVRMYGAGAGKLNDHLYGFGVVWTLLKERRNFDLVYFLMPGVQVAYGVPLARMLGIPSVMKFSGSNDLQDALRSTIGPFEIGALRKWSERIMILNDSMVEESIAAGFDRNLLLWMPNPVDIDQYRACGDKERQQLRAKLDIPVDATVAIFVGRLAPEKELPSLMAGFSIAAAKNASARLVLVGDGPMRQALEKQAEELGIPNRVAFAGMKKPDEIRRWLQAADVFLLVSRREGLPVSLIEAMATSLPSVVTDLAANTQLVKHGEHGLHVKVNDTEGIGEALLRLLDDPVLRRQFGAAARPVSERFSIDRVLTAYEDMFASILDKPRRSRAQ
jgi:glycosyltransferase involved in cell wall biosynthesis